VVPPGVVYDGKGETLTAEGMGDGSFVTFWNSLAIPRRHALICTTSSALQLVQLQVPG
jgi:hypothetical protein